MRLLSRQEDIEASAASEIKLLVVPDKRQLGPEIPLENLDYFCKVGDRPHSTPAKGRGKSLPAQDACGDNWLELGERVAINRVLQRPGFRVVVKLDFHLQGGLHPSNSLHGVTGG